MLYVIFWHFNKDEPMFNTPPLTWVDREMLPRDRLFSSKLDNLTDEYS